ncbi:MAG TPA: 2-succinyl-5-enolpyruvyl-6-hydroxy-3-cyclohexene-1-carboxylic-acid synthase [Gemmatimonadota bacterium]|nr:2-succinyl-5-enolpyruvyl-6-hydroxy-3-cyclohexene-1-carboxylic-acid synthase [Gemmatimonadota bacterium]
MRSENRNAAWASVLVDELARAGVSHACVAPGSRSTPLVVALAEAGGIRTHVHLDERCAAFFALGIGKATGRPAAVVTTSGTAVANLLPAAVEADRSDAPLLLLTADRPARLRGTDANQTIDQVGLFGSRVRLQHEVAAPEASDRALRYLRALAGRAVSAALGPPAGPVHLNVPFEKPLEPTPVPGDVPGDLAAEAPLAAGGRPDARAYTAVPEVRADADEGLLDELAGRLAAARRPLLACGAAPAAPVAGRRGAAAIRLARALGAPLLADPLSGARFAAGAGTWTLGAYDLFLRSAALRGRLAPDLVLRLGPSPTSAALASHLEAHAGAEQLVVDTGRAWPDHGASASLVLRADPARTAASLAERIEEGPVEEAAGGAGAPEAWTATWRAAEAAARAACDAVLADASSGPFEGAVPAALARSLPSGGTLFIGSSMPVRDLDAFGRPRDEPLAVVGNRGASGIDGSVSTALGAAAAGGPVTAILGDLALYHDMNGLLAAGREGLDVVLVVTHNDGGGIFHMLPIREHEPAFTPYFATPHGLDFRHAAAMYGLSYAELEAADAVPAAGGGASTLEEAVADALARGGAHLVVVRSEREANHRRHREAEAAVLEAVEAVGA